MRSKEIGLLIFLFFTSLNGFSQVNFYHPFPDSNAIWREWRSAADGIFGHYEWEEEKFINGDTTIGSLTYHKIYESGLFSHYISFNLDTSYYYQDEYIGALREDSNKRIYAFMNFSNQDTLLYDFNLQVGDTIQHGINHENPDTIIVSSIDSLFDGTGYRKYFHLSNASSPGITNLPSIIEGIGSTKGLFSDFEPELFEMGSILHCCTQNNIIEFTDSSIYACSIINNINRPEHCTGVKIFFDPISSNSIINFDNALLNQEFEIRIFNSLGMLLKTEKELAVENLKINTDGLKCGTYFIIVYNAKYVFNLKLINLN
jgi:hypothetical protein